MAANYWTSTQRQHWQFSKAELAETRRRIEDFDRNHVQQNPLPDWRLLSIYINQRERHQTSSKAWRGGANHQDAELIRLGKRVPTRQQALATAQVYIRRFYIRVEVRKTNPYLVLATAFYLACKMEECPQHIRSVVAEARSLWPGILNRIPCN